MREFKEGYIYLLTNPFWCDLKKIGVSNNIIRRVQSMNTCLPDPIVIKHTSSRLVDKYYYEYLISKYLYKYRYSKKRIL